MDAIFLQFSFFCQHKANKIDATHLSSPQVISIGLFHHWLWLPFRLPKKFLSFSLPPN